MIDSDALHMLSIMHCLFGGVCAAASTVLVVAIHNIYG